jgi:hypothetical protein
LLLEVNGKERGRRVQSGIMEETREMAIRNARRRRRFELGCCVEYWLGLTIESEKGVCDTSI